MLVGAVDGFWGGGGWKGMADLMNRHEVGVERGTESADHVLDKEVVTKIVMSGEGDVCHTQCSMYEILDAHFNLSASLRIRNSKWCIVLSLHALEDRLNQI